MCDVFAPTADSGRRGPTLQISTRSSRSWDAWAALVATSYSPLSPGPIYRGDLQRRAAPVSDPAAATWRPVVRAPSVADKGDNAPGVRCVRVHPMRRGDAPVATPAVPTPEPPAGHGNESPREAAARWLADYEQERERELAIRAQLSARPAGAAR